MVYLEFLRVRRVFVWYAAFLIVVAIMIIYGVTVGDHADFHSQVTDNGTTHSIHSHGFGAIHNADIPIGAILAGCGGFALFFSTFFAASFNRTSQQAHFTFTRPVSRYRMAVEMAGVDIAAIAVAQVLAVVTTSATILICAAIVGPGVHLNFKWESDTIAAAFLGLGCAIMWYGILQAVSAWTPERRGSGVFFGIGIGVLASAQGLSHLTILGPVFVDVFKAILFIDPLAYFSSVAVNDSGDATIGAYFDAPIATRAAIVWTLAAIAIVLASVEWKRVEI